MSNCVSRNNDDVRSISCKQNEIRVWVDGCFDLPHFGHAIFLYRAKSLGNYLIVGVHVDNDVITDKGIVVTPHKDRIKMIRAVKWVDEVVEFPPTKTSLQTLDSHGCEFCVHGDDQIIDQYGVDSYAYAKNVGRYQEVRRCPGVSTTGLIDRILWVAEQLAHEHKEIKVLKKSIAVKPWRSEKPSEELSLERKIFTAHNEPKKTDKIVYTSGSFDLFHVGHVAFLEKCKQQGDYLIVGIHDDDVVSHYNGKYFPITTLHERVLAVSSCRYVDRVIVGAEYIVTAEMLVKYKIDHVIHGMTVTCQLNNNQGQDPYAEPKKRGIFSTVDSGSQFTLKSIIDRILLDKSHFIERNLKKMKHVTQKSAETAEQ